MWKNGLLTLLCAVAGGAVFAGCNDGDDSLGVAFLLEDGQEATELPPRLAFSCDEKHLVAQIRIRGPGGSSPEHPSQFEEGGPLTGVRYLGVSLKDVSPAGALAFGWNGGFIAEGRKDPNGGGNPLPFDPDLDVGEPSAVLTVSAARCDFESATFTIVAFEFEYLGAEELGSPGSALAQLPLQVLRVQQQTCIFVNSGGGSVPPPPGPAPALGPTIAAGGAFSLARPADGTLRSWGSNSAGALANGGSGTGRDLPGQTAFVGHVVAVAAGVAHALAILDDGTVWGWGYDGFGQLGDNRNLSQYVPVQMTGLTQLTASKTAVSAGTLHSLILRSDGIVESTGYNGRGQLGDGTTTDRWEALSVPNLAGIVAIAAGSSHSLALDGSGVVMAWGSNNSGQLGDGTATDRTSPVQVTGLSGMKLIAAGEDFSMAADDVSVWAWGSNLNGKLGDGTEIDRSTPVQIALPGFKMPARAIAAGGQFAMALDDDGFVFTWGINEVGQLGSGSLTPGYRPDPAKVVQFPAAGRKVVEIAAGKASGVEHCLARLDDGTVWAWGYNISGQLGNGDPSQSIFESPVQVGAGLNLN